MKNLIKSSSNLLGTHVHINVVHMAHKSSLIKFHSAKFERQK